MHVIVNETFQASLVRKQLGALIQGIKARVLAPSAYAWTFLLSFWEGVAGRAECTVRLWRRLHLRLLGRLSTVAFCVSRLRLKIYNGQTYTQPSNFSSCGCNSLPHHLRSLQSSPPILPTYSPSCPPLHGTAQSA